MTGKKKVVRTIKADHPDIKKIALQDAFAGQVLRVRYYQDLDTGKTFKTVEIILNEKAEKSAA
ncbi:MAG: hypothetical protein V2I97_17635 [Desulfococcaceae bacterium]|jgi:hypothetical protein|nr:hypothetical protein [Desulfococcaceae bacterium]